MPGLNGKFDPVTLRDLPLTRKFFACRPRQCALCRLMLCGPMWRVCTKRGPLWAGEPPKGDYDAYTQWTYYYLCKWCAPQWRDAEAWRGKVEGECDDGR